MRIEWINKKNSGRIIAYFGGWGMDANAVSHLEKECDIVLFYDYRTLDIDTLPDLSGYAEIYVVAWSMGVWAASQILPKTNWLPVRLIAINGTERPVDNEYGIPENVYLLTEKGLDERGREKFFRRMLASSDELRRFDDNRPCRELDEQCDELQKIRELSICAQQTISWNKVYVSEKDIIFPVDNQLNWWNGKCKINRLPGGHYPFYAFESWEEIIKQ